MNDANRKSATEEGSAAYDEDSGAGPGGRTDDDGEPPETQQLKDELKQSQDMFLRAMADFDNYRKRVERERATAARAGKRDLILKVLDIVDAFERALAHMEGTPDAVRSGVQAIHRQMTNLLQSQGVTPFESVGTMFDPTIQEAIGAEHVQGAEPGTVIDEITRGYRWGDEVLRPASVRVAK
ncbi:MAG TPA: nucleotide exchange factor GrpE [Blastocatellia bacterium]|nr:nucleotide exchange factor GrpE [Blastocatellia bacterium]